jgi:hypothetical protein
MQEAGIPGGTLRFDARTDAMRFAAMISLFV